MTKYKVREPDEIRIRKIDNGFRINKLEYSYEDDHGNDVYDDVETVYQNSYDINFVEGLEDIENPYQVTGLSEKIAMYNVLHHIMSEFDVGYNKHHKTNIEIVFHTYEEEE